MLELTIPVRPSQLTQCLTSVPPLLCGSFAILDKLGQLLLTQSGQSFVPLPEFSEQLFLSSQLSLMQVPILAAPFTTEELPIPHLQKRLIAPLTSLHNLASMLQTDFPFSGIMIPRVRHVVKHKMVCCLQPKTYYLTFRSSTKPMSLKVSRTGQVALPTGFLIAATAASNSVMVRLAASSTSSGNNLLSLLISVACALSYRLAGPSSFGEPSPLI